MKSARESRIAASNVKAQLEAEAHRWIALLQEADPTRYERFAKIDAIVGAAVAEGKFSTDILFYEVVGPDYTISDKCEISKVLERLGYTVNTRGYSYHTFGLKLYWIVV